MSKVRSENKNLEAKVFIQNGDHCLAAAQNLFQSHPFFMYPAATLCHHGIELLLKGCLIWNKSEYPEKHKLLEIAKQIDFLQLNSEYSNLLEKIDTFYFFRYPMDKEDADRIEQQLIRINDNTHGIQNLPGEIGTDDWNKVKKFYDFLIESLPDELFTLYNEIGTIIKNKE